MDGRINNGAKKGEYRGAGRKTKEERQTIAEKLSPLDEKCFNALEQGLEDGQSWAVKLFLQYRYGNPKNEVKVKTEETPKGSIDIANWIGRYKKD